MNLKLYLENKKQEYIQELMVFTHGDVNMASELSGLSKGHLYALLRQYKNSGAGQ